MLKVLLFLLLLVVCWPLALAALFLYPLVWIVLMPFRLIGLVVWSAFALIRAVFLLPIRALQAI